MKKNRIISLFLSVLMVLSLVPMDCLMAFAEDDVVEISSATELAALALAVKGGNHFEGKTIKLTQDIDLSESGNWNPIGYNLNNYFSGVFDGDFHTIYNLSHDYSIDAGNIINTPYQAVGLFGSCKNATIKNIKIDTVSINLINSSGYHNTYSAIDGTNIYTGGLVGYADGTTIDGVSLENVSITGKTQSEAGTCYTGGLIGYATSGSSIIYSSVGTGTINGASSSMNGNSCVGGIVGLMKDEGAIRQSYNAADVNGGHSTGNASTGGIVGKMENSTVETAYITNCYNSGTITHAGSWLETGELGGIAGYAYGSITNCYNSGSIIANTNTVGGDVYVGGIAGNANSVTQIRNCAVVSSKISGGTKRYIISGGGTKSNNIAISSINGSPTNDASAQFSSADFMTSALFINQLGWDFSAIWSIESGQLPKLRVKDVNSEKIELVIAALAQTYIIYAEGDDYSAVTGDISFHNPDNGCVVTWNSDNEAIVNSASGRVSPNPNDCLVRISAEVEKDGYSLTKTFVLNVVGTETTNAPDVEDWAMTVSEARNLVSLMRGCKFEQVSADDTDVLVLTGQNIDEDAIAETMSRFLGFWEVPGESAYLKSKMGNVIQLIKDGADAEFSALVGDFSDGLVSGSGGNATIDGKTVAKRIIAIPKAAINYDLSNIDLINAYNKFKKAKQFSIDEDAYPMENVFSGLSQMAGIFDVMLKTGGSSVNLGGIVGKAETIFTSFSLFKAYEINVQNAQKEYIKSYLTLREQGYEPTDDYFVLCMQTQATVAGTFRQVEQVDKLNEMCELIFKVYSKYTRSVDDSYKVIIQCPVDVLVYNSEGLLVGRVIDNVVDEGINNSIEITLSGAENDIKTIYFQDSDSYSIKLVGNDTGTMNITVDKASAISRQTVEYNDISLENGKEMLMDISSSSFEDTVIHDVVDGVIADDPKSADSAVTGYKLTVYPYQEDVEGVLSYLTIENVGEDNYVEAGTNIEELIGSFDLGTLIGIYTDPECKVKLTDAFMPASDMTVYVKYFVNDARIQITEQPTGRQYVLGDEPEAITVGYESDYETTVKWYSIESDGSRQQITNASGSSYIPDITEVGEKTYVAVISGIDGDESFSAMTEQITISVIDKQMVISGVSGDLKWYLYNDGELVFAGNGAPASYTSKQAPWYQYVDDITKVTFDGSITKISSYMFEDCANLQTLIIPNTVITIEENALKGCVGLTELTIPFVGSARTAQNTYDAVFGQIFGRVANSADGIIQYYKDTDGSLSGYKYGVPPALKKVTITDATQLAFGAFNNCADIETIILNDGIISIAGYAFNGDSAIKSLVIPNSVETIEEFALDGCTSLESLTVPFVGESRNVTNDYTAVLGYIFGRTNEDGTQQFFEFTDGSLYSYVYAIPASLEKVIVTDDPSIALAAFSNCTSLKEIILEQSTSELEDFVLYGINSLDRLEIQNRNCTITDNYNTFSISGTIYGYSGSTAESFANRKNITFVPLDEEHTHIWNNGEITKAATCEEEGVMTFTCTTCGDTRTESIQKTAHTPEVMPAVAATCKATGLTEGSKCSVCGEILVAQEVTPKIAHTWNDGVITKVATCEEEGVTTFTCTACGETKTESIQKADHTPEVMPAVAATCKATGLTEGSKCSVCGEILVAQEVTPKIAHTWNDGVITKVATCEEKGVRTFTCTVCGEGKVESIKAIGHNYGSWTIVNAPTCTAEGSEERVCANDSTHKETRSVQKTSHTDADGNNLCDVCGTEIKTAEASNCVCGKYHTGPFAWLVKFFHKIVYFFKSLFGKN